MRFEYRFEEFVLAQGRRVHEERLNEFGRAGWEVVAVWPEQKGAGTVSRILLKRPFSGRAATLLEGGRDYLFGPRG